MSLNLKHFPTYWGRLVKETVTFSLPNNSLMASAWTFSALCFCLLQLISVGINSYFLFRY